jgi:hypothetical protein
MPVPPLPSDLTLISTCKDWIFGQSNDNVQPATADDAIQRLVSQASRGVLTYLQRGDILPHAVTEIRSGTGGYRMVLRQYPVTAISFLSIGPVVVPTRPPLVGPGSSPVSQVIFSPSPGPPGYVIDPSDEGYPPGRLQGVAVAGLEFTRGAANVQVQYTAGYQTTDAVTLSAAGYTPLAPYGRWAKDAGVTYTATGAALAALPQGSTPGLGQYVPPPFAGTGRPPTWSYTFSAADAGANASLLVTYGYVPGDLDYAAAKWVGEFWKYKTRIGLRSEAMAQGAGTATYNLDAMPKDVQMIIQPYRRVVPVG